MLTPTSKTGEELRQEQIKKADSPTVIRIERLLGVAALTTLAFPVAAPFAYAGFTAGVYLLRQAGRDAKRTREITAATPEECERFHRIVADFCTKAGVETPRTVVINQKLGPLPIVNVGASRILRKGFLQCTSEALNHLSDEEIAGSVAHEMTHYRHADSRISLAIMAARGTAKRFRNFVVFGAAWGAVGGAAGLLHLGLHFVPVALAAGAGAAISGPFLGMAAVTAGMFMTKNLIMCAVEKRADQGGARLLRDPLKMARTLRAVERAGLEGVFDYIAKTLNVPRKTFKVAGEGGKQPGPVKQLLQRLLMDHPTTTERIAALEAMAGAKLEPAVSRSEAKAAEEPRVETDGFSLDVSGKSGNVKVVVSGNVRSEEERQRIINLVRRSIGTDVQTEFKTRRGGVDQERTL